MKDTDQSYVESWNALNGVAPKGVIVVKSSGGAPSAAAVADMTNTAAQQLAKVSETAGNSAAAKSADEYIDAWADDSDD